MNHARELARIVLAFALFTINLTILLSYSSSCFSLSALRPFRFFANYGTILSTSFALFFMYTLNSTQFLFYHTIAVFFLQHQNIALIFLRFSTNLRINFIFFCLIAPNSYIFLLIYSIYCPFVSFFYLFTLNLCYIIII